MEMSKEYFKQYANLVEEWIPKGASIAICAGDQYMYCASSIEDLQLLEGQKILPNSLADQVLKSGCRVEAALDNSQQKSPFCGIGYPITINETKAALIVILPPKHKDSSALPYRFLTGRQEEEWRPIPIEKIAYMESLQKKTWFYANTEPYKTNIPLKELQQRLPETFIRIHRSYIVNVLFIDRIIRDFSSNLLVLLQDGTELPVSQSYIAGVRSALAF